MKVQMLSTCLASAMFLVGGCPPAEDPVDAYTASVDSGSDPSDAAPDPDIDAGLDASVVPADAPISDDVSIDLVDAPLSDDVFSPPGDTGGPDARTTCPTPGARRRLPCECGASRQETCTGGVWVESEACGVECIPGSRRDTPDEAENNCSESHRICGSDCRWGPIVYTVLPGECGPHDPDLCFDTTPYNCRCTPSCTCIDVPDCIYVRM